MTTANRAFEQTLGSMVRGTGVILLGGICGQALGFANSVLLRRNFDVYDVGLISLALSIILFVGPLAELGFGSGLPRFIGYHRARGENGAIRGVIYTAVLLTTVVGVGLSLATFSLAHQVAQRMASPALAPTLRTMAFVGAGLSLISILLGVFRGFAQTRQKLYYDELFPNVIRLLLIVGIVALGGSFTWVAGAYLVSTAAEVVVLVWAMRRTVIARLAPAPIDWDAGKQMMRFSLPLMGSSQLSVAGRQANLFLLGLFLSPADVGLYSTAALVAPVVQTFYGAVRYIFLPVGARLVGANQFDDFNMLFTTVCKWLVALTAPLTALLILLCGPLLALVFGEEYRSATTALQLLAAAYFFRISVGPNSEALTSLGHSAHVFWGFLISNVLALGASFVLIPPFGVLGAALALVTSVVVSNGYMSIMLYRLHRTHPFSRGFVVTTIVMLGLVALGLGAREYLATLPILLTAPVLGIAFTLVSGISTWFLGGIDETDRQLWQQGRAWIRQRLGA